MRCYKVSYTEESITYYAGTQAEARIERDRLIKDLGIKKKDIAIDQTDVPTPKSELLQFINKQCHQIAVLSKQLRELQ